MWYSIGYKILLLDIYLRRCLVVQLFISSCLQPSEAQKKLKTSSLFQHLTDNSHQVISHCLIFLYAVMVFDLVLQHEDRSDMREHVQFTIPQRRCFYRVSIGVQVSTHTGSTLLCFVCVSALASWSWMHQICETSIYNMFYNCGETKNMIYFMFYCLI